MELDYAFCAKFADVGPDGLFGVIGGGLYRVAVPQLPAVLSAMALVGRMTIPPEECEGGQQMQIELFGPTGERHPMEVEFPVVATVIPDEPNEAVKWGFALTLQNVVFGAEGGHEFRLSVDRRSLGTIPIYIKRQAAPQGGQT